MEGTARQSLGTGVAQSLGWRGEEDASARAPWQGTEKMVWAAARQMGVRWGQAWFWRGPSHPSRSSCGLQGQITPSRQTSACELTGRVS